jgi:hypothetical protein
MAKYKLTEAVFDSYDSRGIINKLERDGFTRSEITNAFYKVTEGAAHNKQKQIYDRFYDRTHSRKKYPY